MTEQTTTATASPFGGYFEQIGGAVRQLIQIANEKVSRVKSAGNENALIGEIVDTSDDPLVVQYREFLEKMDNQRLQAEERVTQHIKENLLPKGDDTVDVEKETAEYNELKKGILNQFKAISAFPGGDEFIKTLPELESLGRKSSAGSQTGVRRPRVEKIEVTVAGQDNWQSVGTKKKLEDGTTETVYRMTGLAQWLSAQGDKKFDPSELTRMADEEVKTDDWKTLEGKPFTFSVNTTKGDESLNYMVRITPSAGK